MTMEKGVRLSIIAAVARNRVIGSGGDMPWRLSTDLKRFRQITSGHPVIMGRATFASIGKPLKDRVNIVVTRDPHFAADGTVPAATPDAAVEAALAAAAAQQVDEVFVVGGGQLYELFLPRADRLYITHVEAEPDGDAFFPEIAPAEWRPVREEAFAAGEKDTAPTRFVIYDRV